MSFMALERRSFFALIAALFLPKPKLPAIEDWTVEISTECYHTVKQEAIERFLVIEKWYTEHGHTYRQINDGPMEAFDHPPFVLVPPLRKPWEKSV